MNDVVRFVKQLWEKHRSSKALGGWQNRTHIETIVRGDARISIAHCDACRWWGRPHVDMASERGGELMAREEAGFHAGREHLF